MSTSYERLCPEAAAPILLALLVACRSEPPREATSHGPGGARAGGATAGRADAPAATGTSAVATPTGDRAPVTACLEGSSLGGWFTFGACDVERLDAAPGAECEHVAAPRLPAVDARGHQVAVAKIEDAGLGDLPNLAVRLLSVGTGDVESEFAILEAREIDALTSARDRGAALGSLCEQVRARAEEVARRLEAGRFTPLEPCVLHDGVTAPSGVQTCRSPQKASCGDLRITYQKQTLALAGSSRASRSIPALKAKPVGNPDAPGHTIEVRDCVTAAFASASGVAAVEVRFLCQHGGDWCAPRQPEWHVLGAGRPPR